jgi:predicted O-methyltransferase YrrM
MTSHKHPSKASLLFRLMCRDPGEFRDRLLTVAESQLSRLHSGASWVPVSTADLQVRLQGVLGEMTPYLEEAPLREIERHVSQKQSAFNVDPVFEGFHDSGMALARFCYAVCRLLRPDVVVETGVARGISSAFLLQALAMNGKGALWSVDLPPLSEAIADQTACLVPEGLRGRWHLLRGPTRRLLPQLVSQLPAIDVFLHDSLHTFWNMSREFRTVWPKLREGGVLISDDVEQNRAFETFARRPDVNLAVSASEESKASVFGVMIKAARAGL